MLSKPRPAYADILCVILILSLTALMLWRALLGDRIVSGDHTVHYFWLWYFVTHMFPAGELFGWGNFWSAGEPVGYMYPIGSTLLGALPYYLSFKTMSLGQSYSLAVWLAYSLEGISVYCLGRFAFGRLAGLAAAIMYLTDSGGRAVTGGWMMTLKIGVWPNTFSIAFSTLALVVLLRLLTNRSWRDVGVFALLAGAALICHPLQIINLPILAGVACLCALIAEPKVVSIKTVLQLLCGGAAALLIGSLWLLPFLSAGQYSYSYGYSWHSLKVMGLGLFDGILIKGMWVFPAVLGLLGSVAAIFKGSLRAFVAGILVFVFLIAASSEFEKLLGLVVGSGYTGKIEFPRFVLLLRPFWFAAAGFALVQVFGPIPPPYCAAKPGVGRGALRAALSGLLLLPFLLSFTAIFFVRQAGPPLKYASLRSDNKERSELVAELNKIAEADPRFFRVALFEEHYHYRYLDLGTELKAPIFNINWTPASTYRYRLGRLDPDAMQAMNVRFVLATQERQKLLENFNSKFTPIFRPLGRYGDLTLNEFTLWQPEPYQIRDGAGEIAVNKFEAGEIEIEAGPGSHGKLILTVSNFDRWQARLNGKIVPIYTSSIGAQGESAFLTVDLAPGKYQFKFVRRWPERLAPFLFILGVISALGLVFWVGRPPTP